jgi:glycosyltransferase involved in cell wall biosynthesis
MQKKKLVYIANARLPTEKAHGYQICRMCEAFALNGVGAVLLHPKRHQLEPALRGRSVFDYYGIRPIFEVQTLANWDVVPLSRLISHRWFTPIFFAHAMIWGFYAAICACRQHADLYYTRESPVAFWLLQMGMPTVYESHVVPKRGQRWLLERIACYPDLQLVVALTSFIKERFVRMGFPAAKVLVQPDGVDLSLFENLPGKNECRKRLGLPEDCLIIGYIGRFKTLEMEKGIPELIHAMTYLLSFDGKEPLLMCVGGPMDAVPRYVSLARRLGVPDHRVRFIDRVPNSEVPSWMHACDVVTIPWPWTEFSAYFTSPLKLFEYMAAGVPIVATDLPSLREVLRHGENAWLVEAGSPRSLADGLRLLLSQVSIAQRLAKNARSEVQRFTWQKRAQGILNHLEKANAYR